MNLNSRITELQRKHMSLGQAVESAQKFPASGCRVEEEKAAPKRRNFTIIGNITGH